MKSPGSENHGFTSIDQAAADVVLSAAFSPSGNRIALSSADHRIRVYDADPDNSWNLVDQWRGHDAEVLDASLPHAPRTLLVLMLFCKG